MGGALERRIPDLVSALRAGAQRRARPEYEFREYTDTGSEILLGELGKITDIRILTSNNLFGERAFGTEIFWTYHNSSDGTVVKRHVKPNYYSNALDVVEYRSFRDESESITGFSIGRDEPIVGDRTHFEPYFSAENKARERGLQVSYLQYGSDEHTRRVFEVMGQLGTIARNLNKPE